MSNRTLIVNGRIWTGNRQQKWAEALVIEGKDIVYVGEVKKAGSIAGEDPHIVDAEGKMIIPSFIDSHTHLTAVAKSKWCFLLEQKDYGSVEEIMEIVRDYADQVSAEECPYIYAYSCPTELMDKPGVDRYLMDRYV